MRRALLRVFIALLALTAFVYLCDFLRWRTGFPGHRAQFLTVHVRPYLAVPQKNGRLEFIPDNPADEPCATSLFPHGGAPPCWYLRRHTNKWTKL